MTKVEFLNRLGEALRNVHEENRQKTLDYYAEMVDDRMDDGLSEEEAVAAVGDLDEIVQQVLSEMPQLPRVVEVPVEEQTQKRSEKKIGNTLLLILGSPVWVPLLIAAVAVIFSVLVTLWAVVVSLYATAVALGAAAIGCVVASVFVAATPIAPAITLGVGLVCAGLTILFVLLSNLAAKGMARLTKLAFQWIKSWFKKKG